LSDSKATGNHVYHIIAFCFSDRDKGDAVSKEVMKNQKLGGYKVAAHAVVEVDGKGKPHVHEPGHGGWGAGIGAGLGGLLGLIGGPAGLLAWAVAGGAIGGVAGHYMGRAIPAKELEELGKQMQPNSSAFLALVEDVDAEKVIGEMKGYQANVVTLIVGDEASGEVAAAIAADVTTPAAASPAASTGGQSAAPAATAAPAASDKPEDKPQ
jgi:uncharacterized membrane protein